jgi:hypothetical protein
MVVRYNKWVIRYNKCKRTSRRGSINVMRHEEKYCIWSGISIRGCPLEEASE